jgi:DNA-binding NarL/FixJ family response regulator
MAQRGITIALISDSKLILNGVRKILEFEPGIIIVAEGTGLSQLKYCARVEKPDFIFLDNRESAYDVGKLMRSRAIRASNITVIQFTQVAAGGEGISNLINVDHETTSTELVAIIKKKGARESKASAKSADEPEYSRITKTESRIIKLIAAGESNKEIAKKLSVSEKTVKAHITNIFEKLHLQNRYQLMLYGKRKKKNAEMGI